MNSFGHETVRHGWNEDKLNYLIPNYSKTKKIKTKANKLNRLDRFWWRWMMWLNGDCSNSISMHNIGWNLMIVHNISITHHTSMDWKIVFKFVNFLLHLCVLFCSIFNFVVFQLRSWLKYFSIEFCMPVGQWRIMWTFLTSISTIEFCCCR